jgi:flagellar biosynthesis protein FliP
MSPAAVALPAKLLLFVMADGWHLLARALVLAYR